MRLSNSPNDDLVLLDRASHQLRILTIKEAPEIMTATLTNQNKIITALPMRLNASAQTGLVVLRKDSPAPFVLTPEAAMTFTVTSTGDGADTNLTDGVCRASDGSCTLRAAIQEANANAGVDTIAFNIASGRRTIFVNSQLPNLASVIINGLRTDGTRMIVRTAAELALGRS